MATLAEMVGMGRGLLGGVLVAGLGCSPSTAVDSASEGGGSTGGTSGGAGPTTGVASITEPGTSDPSGASEGINPHETGTTESLESSGLTDTGSFIEVPDGGGGLCSTVSICDVWAQDCPEGEKCVPFDGDGEPYLEGCVSLRCSPLDPDPVLPGAGCFVEEGPWSGIDNCDIGSFCWDVDPVTLQGVCVAHCMGSEANPLCDEGLVCFEGYSGVIIACVRGCDPLVPVCGDTGTCTTTEGDPSVCLPTSLGLPATQAESCDHTVGCGEGFVCMAADRVAGCEDPSTCCTALCDPLAAACDESVPVCSPLDGSDVAGACTID